jgi:hypothetical protein
MILWGSMQVSTRLFLDQADCEANGAEIEAMRSAEDERLMNDLPEGRRIMAQRRFPWRCVRHLDGIQVSRPVLDAQ